MTITPEHRDGRAEGLAIALDAQLRAVADLLIHMVPAHRDQTIDGIVGWLATNSTSGGLAVLAELADTVQRELRLPRAVAG